MSLSGKSQIYGLLGDPVAHSLSPMMQNQTFQAHHIDAVYVPFHVRPENLSAAVNGLRALNVAGVNVTIPHKETILPLLDQIDPTARLIGAVNTVVNRAGGMQSFTSGGRRGVPSCSCWVSSGRCEINFYCKSTSGPGRKTYR